MSISFKGRLAGVDYDQGSLFEQAAQTLGYTFARRSWKPGAGVTVQLRDGSRVSGQVWAKASGSDVWAALDDGRYVLISVRSRSVYSYGQQRRTLLGDVA